MLTARMEVSAKRPQRPVGNAAASHGAHKNSKCVYSPKLDSNHDAPQRMFPIQINHNRQVTTSSIASFVAKLLDVDGGTYDN
jgi:hypothetical protein